MQPNSQQQAYDRGITIFSPDGRLYQVEYAREAVKRGTASVGVAVPEGVVLAAFKRVGSSLMESETIEKIFKIDSHIGAASAGHVTDARKLIDKLREESQVNRASYKEPIGVETAVRHLSDEIQEFTQRGGVRPFGVALIAGGIEDGEPRVFETDPSGSFYEWKATAIGSDSNDIIDYLEETYEDDMSLDDAVGLALDAAAESRPDDEETKVENFEVAVIETETENYTELSNDEISEHL
ncbi:archaeal proteasome endopeptidase complex subunit alpha [Halorutilales archaeon Cl-col2-1]|nr:archaeal proteasome endopeptidase complex subunit alpha [Halobacteria archaeon]